jgi:hypothetical protein
MGAEGGGGESCCRQSCCCMPCSCWQQSAVCLLLVVAAGWWWMLNGSGPAWCLMWQPQWTRHPHAQELLLAPAAAGCCSLAPLCSLLDTAA